MPPAFAEGISSKCSNRGLPEKELGYVRLEGLAPQPEEFTLESGKLTFSSGNESSSVFRQ